jgi:hypothetical protein
MYRNCCKNVGRFCDRQRMEVASVVEPEPEPSRDTAPATPAPKIMYIIGG